MKTIFLVEDEKFLVGSLSEFLRQAGYAIEVAYNGSEALEMLPVVRPDLILLDIVLPEMSGIDFLKKVQQENSEFSNVPVLVLTNLQGNEESFEKLGLKVEGYLVKANISLEDLRGEVKRILK